MRRVKRREKPEPTIALINIVFLMLIFFLIAGTLSQPVDGTLSLVKTAELDGRDPSDALVIHDDGRLSHRGQDLADVSAFTSGLSDEALAAVRIMPDRDLDASRLVDLSRALRASGAQSVVIVTERALQ